MTDKVKPLAQDCPFCGKGARTWEDELGFRGASCSDAECSASELIMTIEQWNRRTPPAGFALVSVELNEEMATELLNSYQDNVEAKAPAPDLGTLYERCQAVWSAILSAAPRQEGE